ncbi:hypothetical protein [Xanthomonas theicola]|uniref:hypothetical protein n=1 Tax=Xanthomonas theicola TaxID=56464 RepID=UPI000FF89F54|nr:hypothetical protein [Xanthomonas theicola]
MSLLAQHKNGLSALAWRRQLGGGDNTAWLLKHNLMQVMVERDADRPLQGDIRLHHAYRGGERRGQGRGRASPGKTPFVAAVQCSPEGHPIAMRMERLAGFRTADLAIARCCPVAAGRPTGCAALRRLPRPAACARPSSPAAGGPTEPALAWVNTLAGQRQKRLAWHLSCTAAQGPAALPAACPNCAAASTGPWTWPPWCGDGSSRRGLRHRCRIQGQRRMHDVGNQERL